MSSDCFRFKHFTIAHDRTAMRVGTDGVLLGAWCDTRGATRILDIGTGSGLIAVMLAQRCDAVITGVEIDEDAAAQAAENATNCPWSNRLHIVRHDVRAFCAEEKFDLIVSNPPFFETSKTTTDGSRKTARQTTCLSHTELLEAVAALLAPQGKFAVVLPTTVADKFTFIAWENNLRVLRRTDVKTTPRKPAKRTLLEFTNAPKCEVTTTTLTLNDETGNRSFEYAALTNEFYL